MMKEIKKTFLCKNDFFPFEMPGFFNPVLAVKLSVQINILKLLL